eukprot:8360723-Alexandrium_andersonii.AAC.1
MSHPTKHTGAASRSTCTGTPVVQFAATFTPARASHSGGRQNRGLAPDRVLGSGGIVLRNARRPRAPLRRCRGSGPPL